MDETVYNSKILNNKNIINACNRTIKNLNDEIEELEVLKRKVVSLRDSVEEAANKTITKINDLPNIFAMTYSVLNVGFFSKITNVVKGSEYSKAYEHMGMALTDIQRKINELNSQIEKNRTTINQCNRNINNLKIQHKKNIKE